MTHDIDGLIAPNPLVTISISIDRNGSVYEDTQCHGNTWAEVYRGKTLALKRMRFLVEENRQCPFHPLTQSGEGS
jgi:hypothetical protein